MSSPYARLRRTSNDHSDSELNDAFGDEDDNEATPLNPNNISHQIPAGSGTNGSCVDVTPLNTPGTYDFERDYDHPPPGSPPALSSVAMPNTYGNSNGLTPSPVQVQRATSTTRPGPFGFLRRTVGAILPSHYVRVPTADADSATNGGRVVGGGTDNDGVFSNVAAKPSNTMHSVVTDDGDIRLVPETQVQEAPPSYTSAQADAVPPYWENTIHVPPAQDPDALIIEDLPAGNFPIFLINCVISFFFQFVGFFLTYIIASTHAAKFGSRAGLGLTLIQFGYTTHYWNQPENRHAPSYGAPDGSHSDDWQTSASGMWHNVMANTTTPIEEGGDSADGYQGNHNQMDGFENDGLSYNAKEWLSFLMMTIGWILLLSSAAGFWRVKRWETSLRAGNSSTSTSSSSTTSTSTPSATPAPEQPLDQATAARDRFYHVLFGAFRTDDTTATTTTGGNTYARTAVDDPDDDDAGLPLYHAHSDRTSGGPEVRTDQYGRVIVIPDQRMLQEARLTRDLRAAGLI